MVANLLCILLYLDPLRDMQAVALHIDTALQTAAYLAWTAIYNMLKISPGALVFQQDMLLNIPIIADLQLLQQKHQFLIDKNLMHANHKCISHDYQPGNEVLVLTHNPATLDERADGPYTIVSVHTNGTISIRCNPHVMECLSI